MEKQLSPLFSDQKYKARSLHYTKDTLKKNRAGTSKVKNEMFAPWTVRCPKGILSFIEQMCEVESLGGCK